MSQARILLVDDEPAIVETVRAYLEAEGYTVRTAFDDHEALTLACNFHPDIIVLDLMLPGLDGLEVLRRLRQVSDVYVLLLTAKTHETDKVVGLTMGADDYVTKPFSPRELVARVKALLRRGRSSGAGDAALASAACASIPRPAASGRTQYRSS
jgi:DNA-binding response OmpR family regulator